jgi:peptide/nickel transport system permease protein
MRAFFRRAGLSPGAWLGAGMLLAFLLAATLGPWLAPFSPEIGDLDARNLGPNLRHWLGTDDNGVDVVSELLFGARMALQISGVVVLVSAVIGVAVGTIAGYFRGWVDEVLMRVIDILLAFPGILLNLAIVAVVKRPDVGIVIFALCINGWVGYARVARGQVLSLREREYVTAARAVGAGPLRVMALHVIPNLLSPLLVQMTFAFGGVIAVESTLSFLGLGPPVNYSWGALLDQGRSILTRTQRMVLVPGIAIAWVILASNLLGDGLRDRLDPRRLKS